MAELRRHQRTGNLKTATIRYGEMTESVICTVVNLSQGGACIFMRQTDGVPDDFQLTMDADGTTHACRAIWRTKTRLGVSFRPD
jgi:hypothetical protein